MKLTIDFETRSKVSIQKAGAYVYAQDPSTRIICLAVKKDAEPVRIWLPDYFARILIDHLSELPLIPEQKLLRLVQTADTIEAHNAGFEGAIWHYICRLRLGWPAVPLEKWRCSAAKAAAATLPRSLDKAAAALDLPVRKDKKGHFVMLKLSKPRKPTKHNPALWHEAPEELLRLCRYCIRDVETEYALSAALRNLPASEQQIWRLDQVINARGMQVDVNTCRKAIALIRNHETRLLGELKTLSQGAVETPKQLVAMLEWIESRGVRLENLRAATVKKALEDNTLPADVHRALEIRRSLSLSSTAKYQALVDRTNKDGRLQGLLLYHGAATGRWAGMGVQPQNLPRGIFDDTDFCIELIRKQNPEMIELIYGDLMTALSTCIRPMLCAAPGRDLICADFSAIEGRVLAWLAGENWVLREYAKGKDMYVVNAARTLLLSEEKITPKLRQEFGKPGELACGYGGGAGAVRAFGGGAGMTDAQIMKRIVRPWRRARPRIVHYWRDLEKAAMQAIRTRRPVQHRHVVFRVDGDFLLCRLPSGRHLSYFDPAIEDRETPWGEIKPQIAYTGVDSYTRKWRRQHTHGAKLTENIDQAVSRDLMALAMLRVERAGYRVVLTVHDEIVAEVPEGFGNLKEFETLMARAPAWAKDLPVAASGWRGKRYRKE